VRYQIFVGINSEKTAWRFAPPFFIQQLQLRCPQSAIRELKPRIRSYSHEWTLQGTPQPLEGVLNRAGTCVVLVGSLEDCSDFALWLRRVVPTDIELICWDAAFTPMPILLSTTAAEIASHFE
jgi:hypothetical protein